MQLEMVHGLSLMYITELRKTVIKMGFMLSVRITTTGSSLKTKQGI